MIQGLIFLAVGFLLVALEFLLPGGVVGAAGAVFMVVGIVMFAMNSPSMWLTIGMVVASGVLLAFMIRFTLKRMRSTKQESSLYLHKDQEGYKASNFQEELVGKEGVVYADLKPAGHVFIEGKKVQAVSKMGYLSKGTSIVVISGEGAHLIVRKKED